MKIVSLNLSDRGYRIYIENGLLTQVGSLLHPWRSSPRLVVISSRQILDLHGEALQRSLSDAGLSHETLEIPDGERHKTLSTLESIYKGLAGLGVNRRTPVLALGGGVVGDVAGFAAASYLRGLPYVQVPTTLVAQIDSAIGGKTGVNLSKGKNLVGAFYQPGAVFIDPELLLTLPRRELDSGLFEAIKYGIIADRDLYDQVVRQHHSYPGGDKSGLARMIVRCVEIKAAVVSGDERESQARMVLNFGHTLGHAIEAATRYSRFTHGQAIGHGMILATRIALQLEKIDRAEAETIQSDLRRLSPLPPLGDLAWKSILHPMRSDKKFTDHRLRFVLPRRIGEVEIVEDTPPEVVEAVVREYLCQSRRPC